MGRITAELTITASLSDHNSDEDAADRGTWARFAAEVRSLAEKPEYRELEIDVTETGA